jgi:hypothetical protein
MNKETINKKKEIREEVSEEEEMELFLKKKEIQNKLLKKIIEKINQETDKSNK